MENIESTEIVGTEEINLDEVKVAIDQAKVDSIQKELEDLKSENSEKEYIVKMDSDLLGYYEYFIANQAPWKGKEGLGIMELGKKISDLKKKGIKDNSVYMNNLHIEATHYFLGKYEGVGNENIDKYVQLYKNIENALTLVASDNQKVKDLQKELIAAQQGIETC